MELHQSGQKPPKLKVFETYRKKAMEKQENNELCLQGISFFFTVEYW